MLFVMAAIKACEAIVQVIILVIILNNCGMSRLDKSVGELATSQTTRNIHTMLVQCWDIVCDAGPTLYQLWLNVSCFLGVV